MVQDADNPPVSARLAVACYSITDQLPLFITHIFLPATFMGLPGLFTEVAHESIHLLPYPPLESPVRLQVNNVRRAGHGAQLFLVILLSLADVVRPL